MQSDGDEREYKEERGPSDGEVSEEEAGPGDSMGSGRELVRLPGSADRK